MEILSKDVEYISSEIDFSRFKNKRLLITGANGFLGRNFINVLMENRKYFEKLIFLDKNFPGNSKSDKAEFIKSPISRMPKVKFIDYIIHLASIASPAKYLKSSLDVINVNILGLWKILNWYKKGLESFLYLSSSEIYGNAEVIPTPETYLGKVDILNPRSCYSESKRMGENLCLQYHDLYDMPIKIVRPFNNYGPLMSINDGRLPADLARAFLGEAVIFRTPNNTRAFCYVADALIGYFKALQYDKFDVFNIGNPEEVTIKEFIDKFIEIAKNYKISINVEWDHIDDGNPKRRCPDITKANKILGYKPKILLDAGLKRYIKYLSEL